VVAAVIVMRGGQTTPDPHLGKKMQGFLGGKPDVPGPPGGGGLGFAHDMKQTCLNILTSLCQVKEFPSLPGPIRMLSAYAAVNYCRAWPAP
jgi:hypothetical protein